MIKWVSFTFFADWNSWFSVSTTEPLQLGSASQGPLEPTIPQFLLKLLWPHSQKPTVSEIGSKPHNFQNTVVPGESFAAQTHPSNVPIQSQATRVSGLLPFNCFMSWFPVLHFLFSLSFLPCVLSLQKTGCHLHSQTTRRFLLNCTSYIIGHYFAIISTGLTCKAEAY